MYRTALWLTAALFVVGCPKGSDKTDDTDLTTDDTVEDTDTDGHTDTVKDTDIAVVDCDDSNACTGCEQDGEAVTCDCSADVSVNPSTCRPVRIAILDDALAADDSSGARLKEILEDATWDGSTPMFSVSLLGRRWDWRGSVYVPNGGDTGLSGIGASEPLSVDNTDAIFLLEALNYTTGLNPAGDAALASFVAAGGGLIRTEWGASYYQLEYQYCPVQRYVTYDESHASISWALVASSDPIAAVLQRDLPATFEMNGSFVQADLKTIAMTGDVAPVSYLTGTLPAHSDVPAFSGQPGVVYWPASTASDVDHGPIIWMNHDFAYENNDSEYPTMTDPQFRQLMWNLARAAAVR